MRDMITRRQAWFTIGLLWTLGAAAQPGADAVSAFVDCVDIQSEDERLACYDRAVDAVRAEQPGASQRITAADQPDATLPPQARATAPRPPQADGAASAAQPNASAARPNASPAPPNAPAAQPSATVDAAENTLGNRGVDDDNDDGDQRVTVVEVRTTIPGRAVFFMSDGRSFVQTGGPMRLLMPDVPFDAVLQSGLVGGVFLRPDGARLRIRVSARD